MSVTIKIDSHLEEFLDALEERIPLALEACGYRAEEISTQLCPVDTGLLRNSITFALDGERPQKTAYHVDPDKVKGNAARIGWYQGQAQKEKDSGKRSMILGTNVEYATYVELGTSRSKKKQPFIAPAIKNYRNDYKQILERYLKKGS